MCSACGTRDSDWIDPETEEFHWPPLLTTEMRRCQGCAEAERLLGSLPKDADRAGLRVVLKPFRDPSLDIEPEAVAGD